MDAGSSGGRASRTMTGIASEVQRRSRAAWRNRPPVTMIGVDPSLGQLLAKVQKVARFNEPVLVTGESGVGKESLAQSLYLLSPRCGKPFVSVNCPQHREGNLTVSELFGHKRGSFSGATADRKGCSETADSGVAFLDEIGDLHMSAQVMLLRALASGEFRALGSDVTRRVNVRIVAATNRPLEKLVVAEQFRNDLFFRLRYFHLKIPPLRERGDDWRLLTDHFLGQLRKEHGVAKHFSREAMLVLSGYPWPGNIRELRSVVTMGYAMAERDVIEPSDFASILAEDQPIRSADDDPYERIVHAGETFWDAVHRPFMARDLNRRQVRAVVSHGLRETGGSYRKLLPLFNVADSEYQRLMDFLRHQDLKP